MKDKIFKIVLICSALTLLVMLAGTLYALISQSIPAFNHFGFFRFIFSPEWDPSEGNEKYGALSFIIGTLLTSFLALLISVPFSLSLALLNAEIYKGEKIAYYANFVVGLVTGIPSIILGIWGFYILRPIFISLNIGHQGYGIFTTSLVLSLMIIPYASSISSNFLSRVPQKLKESAYSLGATRLEVIMKICLPYAKKGIISAYAFALAKVMGEAVVVAILVGKANHIPSGITDTGNTMSGIIINQFGSFDDLKLSSLYAIALILFVLTSIINFGARYITRRDVV